MFGLLCVLFVTFEIHECADLKNRTILTSTYAKVSSWGATKKQPVLVEEGRSSGQTLYTQRAEARISTGKNVPSSKHQFNSRAGDEKDGDMGAGDAVLQERFNPPPYFEFSSDPKKEERPSPIYSPETEVDVKPSISFDLHDTYSPQSNIGTKRPINLYDSPISSYNPKPSGIPSDFDKDYEVKPMQSYGPPEKPLSVYGPSKPSYNPSDSYKPSKDFTSKPSFSLGETYDSMKNLDSKPPMPSYMPQATYGPSQEKPSKFPAYVYDHSLMSDSNKYLGPYAPVHDEDYKEHDLDKGRPDEEKGGPPITPTIKPPGFDQYPGNADDQEHNFPKHIPEFLDHDPSGKFPYDVGFNFDHHHHHPIYHEVKTTTTEPPEDERVNKGHYSYYYLGRKLYYVPLYFSIYFIIYITVLILKSIARHKVNFVHNWENAKGRSLDIDNKAEEVHRSINNFRKRYIAM